MTQQIYYQPSHQGRYEGSRVGFGKCFGTFGELLQGGLPDQKCNFLVTLPISQYSAARFTVLPDTGEVSVFPQHKQKARRLAQSILQLFDLKMGGVLSIQSELEEGKGCASSSADLVATSLALESSFDFSIPPALLAKMMASIEPSDGVMYQGIVSFYHREGILHKFLGHLPPLTIVALDEGGQIDTIEFNKRPRSFTHIECLEYEQLLCGLEQAIAHHDLLTLGDVATRSAILNQKLLPKPSLELFLDMRQRYNALGVVAAHSGTYLGLLLDPKSLTYAHTLSAVAGELGQYSSTVKIFYTHIFSESLPAAPHSGEEASHRASKAGCLSGNAAVQVAPFALKEL